MLEHILNNFNTNDYTSFANFLYEITINLFADTHFIVFAGTVIIATSYKFLILPPPKRNKKFSLNIKKFLKKKRVKHKIRKKRNLNSSFNNTKNSIPDRRSNYYEHDKHTIEYKEAKKKTFLLMKEASQYKKIELFTFREIENFFKKKATQNRFFFFGPSKKDVAMYKRFKKKYKLFVKKLNRVFIRNLTNNEIKHLTLQKKYTCLNYKGKGIPLNSKKLVRRGVSTAHNKLKHKFYKYSLLRKVRNIRHLYKRYGDDPVFKGEKYDNIKFKILANMFSPKIKKYKKDKIIRSKNYRGSYVKFRKLTSFKRRKSVRRFLKNRKRRLFRYNRKSRILNFIEFKRKVRVNTGFKKHKIYIDSIIRNKFYNNIVDKKSFDVFKTFIDYVREKYMFKKDNSFKVINKLANITKNSLNKVKINKIRKRRHKYNKRAKGRYADLKKRPRHTALRLFRVMTRRNIIKFYHTIFSCLRTRGKKHLRDYIPVIKKTKIYGIRNFVINKGLEDKDFFENPFHQQVLRNKVVIKVRKYNKMFKTRFKSNYKYLKKFYNKSKLYNAIKYSKILFVRIMRRVKINKELILYKISNFFINNNMNSTINYNSSINLNNLKKTLLKRKHESSKKT